MRPCDFAHVVPAGGRRCTLLCKQCNSAFGAGIEGQAAKRKKVFDRLAGAGEGATSIRVGVAGPDGQEFTLNGPLLGSLEQLRNRIVMI